MVRSRNRAPGVGKIQIKYAERAKKTPLLANTMRIGEVAKKVGMPVVSVRFYELEKLILPVKIRGLSSKHRRFYRSVIAEIDFIQSCRAAGFSIPEIRSIMKLFRGFKPPAKPQMTALHRTIDTIRDRKRRLEEVERILLMRMRDPEADIEKLIDSDEEILRLRGLKQKP